MGTIATKTKTIYTIYIYIYVLFFQACSPYLLNYVSRRPVN